MIEQALAAADDGDAMAQEAVGTYYYSGYDGEPVDIDRACHYLTLAGSQDRITACFQLAKIYFYGIGGLEVNLPLALLWATKTKFDLDGANELDGEGNIDDLLGAIKQKLSPDRSDPRPRRHDGLSHEQMAKKIQEESYSTMRGVIGESDSRPVFLGKATLPVAYVEYVKLHLNGMKQTNWPAGDVHGYLRNAERGDIVLFPGWCGTTRRESDDVAYVYDGAVWMPRRP